jgi:hypothetical protein
MDLQCLLSIDFMFLWQLKNKLQLSSSLAVTPALAFFFKLHDSLKLKGKTELPLFSFFKTNSL